MEKTGNYFSTDYLYDTIPEINGKKVKVNVNNFIIPNIENYTTFLKINYNLSQLKKIARHYKQRVTGKKKELVTRLYNFLKFSFYATCIQNFWKKQLRYKYHLLHGPAVNKRGLCNNINDFLSFDDIDDIPYSQFFSYKDKDNFVYGFNIKSFYNLLINDTEPKNPYNRELISDVTKLQFINLLFLRV